MLTFHFAVRIRGDRDRATRDQYVRVTGSPDLATAKQHAIAAVNGNPRTHEARQTLTRDPKNRSGWIDV